MSGPREEHSAERGDAGGAGELLDGVEQARALRAGEDLKAAVAEFATPAAESAGWDADPGATAVRVPGRDGPARPAAPDGGPRPAARGRTGRRRVHGLRGCGGPGQRAAALGVVFLRAR
jgi:hypothetical protein